ncbi:MAG: ricin-type beta-trefoil lectin domain protein [Roseibium sp.]
MRQLILALCLTVVGTAQAAEKPEIERLIKAALQNNDQWKTKFAEKVGRAPLNNEELIDVEFIGNAAALPVDFELPTNGAPAVLQQSALLNCSDLPQSATFSVDKTSTRTVSVNWSQSVKLGASVKLSGKVPGVGALEGSTSAETTSSIGGTLTSTETLHWRIDQPTDMNPKTLQIAQFVIEEVEANDVPITLNILYSGAYKMIVGTPTYRVRNVERNKCLDVKGETGPEVITWTCHNRRNQQWVVRNNKLISRKPNGQCLDVKRASDKSGADLIVWNCHSRSNQKFDFDVNKTGQIRTFSDKCLNASAGKVETRSCNGSDRRKWTFEPVENVRKITLTLEDLLPEAEDRTISIDGTVDVAAGLNGTVRWGQTQPVTDAYCSNETYDRESEVDMPLARGETAVRSQEVSPALE